jgi:(+)-trans-carveol dehydrogenase
MSIGQMQLDRSGIYEGLRMGRVEGKVALITGAARGRGRSHAVRLAGEGADIIAVDMCAAIPNVTYPPPTPGDLATTVKEVEALDRRIVAAQVDTRGCGARQAVDGGVAQLGRLDIVAADIGVACYEPAAELDETTLRDMIDTNLARVWNTALAAIPHLIAGGRGGSIVLSCSTDGLTGTPNAAHHSAARHGVAGLMRALALELAPHSIRVNSICPTNAPPIPGVEPVDISSALLFLASDEARYMTGVMYLAGRRGPDRQIAKQLP